MRTQHECKPRGIQSTRPLNGAMAIGIRKLKGDWLRVFPEGGRDVLLLQSLPNHCDRCAPAEGHGLLVSTKGFKTISPKITTHQK